MLLLTLTTPDYDAWKTLNDSTATSTSTADGDSDSDGEDVA